jgi:hypothetical protein
VKLNGQIVQRPHWRPQHAGNVGGWQRRIGRHCTVGGGAVIPGTWKLPTNACRSDADHEVVAKPELPEPIHSASIAMEPFGRYLAHLMNWRARSKPCLTFNNSKNHPQDPQERASQTRRIDRKKAEWTSTKFLNTFPIAIPSCCDRVLNASPASTVGIRMSASTNLSFRAFPASSRDAGC